MLVGIISFAVGVFVGVALAFVLAFILPYDARPYYEQEMSRRRKGEG